MTRRESLIVQLLRARGFAEPGGGGGQRPGQRDGVALLPHDEGCRVLSGTEERPVEWPLRCSCWLASWAELERRLTELRTADWRLWDAVCARYVNCERRPREVTVKRWKPVRVPGQEVLGLLPVKGKERDRGISRKGDGTCRVLVESWDATVAEADWLAGVAWLAERFEGPLRLPAEMVSGVAA